MKSLFAAVLLFFAGLFQSHHPITIQPTHVLTPTIAASTQTAAVLNAALASEQPTTTTVAANPSELGTQTGAAKPQPPAPAMSFASPPTSASVLPAPAPATYVTQDELTAQLQGLNNSLRTLVYQNTNGGTQWQVGEGEYASGGYTNNIAVSNALDQLNGTTLNNVTINGLSGLTATEIPTNIVAANYLPLAGGTLTGGLIDAATASSSFAGALGIGTTSPSDLFALKGAAYLADITPPANTVNRLYSNAGSLYWAGNLVGGGSVGNWASDGTNVWRAAGKVGIGTTSPLSALTVSGGASIGADYNISAPTDGLIVEGNVGIGTVTPTSTLAVHSTEDGNEIQIGFVSSVQPGYGLTTVRSNTNLRFPASIWDLLASEVLPIISPANRSVPTLILRQKGPGPLRIGNKTPMQI
jgi:hypothetical protein